MSVAGECKCVVEEFGSLSLSLPPSRSLVRVSLTHLRDSPCRYFRTPHALSNMGQSCHTATTGPTMAHYTLTASKRRIAILQAAWERDEPGKHATCSISHKGGLGCSDYHEQLRFMAAQDRTPTRPLAPLCMTPLVGSETSRYEEPADWNALFAGSGLV